ncbi:hypothetical protein PISMIDRAFT_680882 [Pisolithus microcarpus 441]|uniref:G domain-containing protein n=1 Tax=Pisolithus microcarpus 441 TaxID=765257 RepID=A0A0C9YYS4_9AGAM|nr:hypothetical protein PISMIDRAFT_680882 [Pisolithus microcarpus 441]
MAPGRFNKWIKSLGSGSGSRRSHQDGVADQIPAETGATASAAGDLAGDATSPIAAQMGTTLQATTSSQPAFRLDSEMADQYMKNIKRFRVLVMGRANAGKTTILQRVCNSTDKPEIFDGKGNKIEDTIVQGTETRGYHDVECELVFRSNPGFVFHDSCGFEAGSTEQIHHMRKFVVDRATTKKVNERIHAIWFCIPMTDNHRMVTAAEQKFFDECDTRHVPVIVVLTKVDALCSTPFGEFRRKGLSRAEAKEKAVERQGKLLEECLERIKLELDKCKYPPRRYVTLQNMHEEHADCTALIQSTANGMNAEDLQMLIISTQQSSVLLCIEYAVRKTLRRHLELGLMGRLQVDVKKFESALLGWFPNCDPKFEVDVDTPMPPLPKDVTLLGKFPTLQSIVEHAIGCLLVAEHSFFLMQQNHSAWKEVLTLAVKEYGASNMQLSVSKVVGAIFHQCNGDMNGLCDGIIKIVGENRMSNKLLMEPGAKGSLYRDRASRC